MTRKWIGRPAVFGANGCGPWIDIATLWSAVEELQEAFDKNAAPSWIEAWQAKMRELLAERDTVYSEHQAFTEAIAAAKAKPADDNEMWQAAMVQQRRDAEHARETDSRPIGGVPPAGLVRERDKAECPHCSVARGEGWQGGYAECKELALVWIRGAEERSKTLLDWHRRDVEAIQRLTERNKRLAEVVDGTQSLLITMPKDGDSQKIHSSCFDRVRASMSKLHPGDIFPSKPD